MPSARIAIDSMGGDNAPQAALEGIITAARKYPDIEMHVFGDEAVARGALTGQNPGNIVLHHCSQVVTMCESPVSALKKKPDSSIVRATLAVKEGLADCMLSMGNTGACVAAATLYFKKLPGVQRPGILSLYPTLAGPGLLMDVGANINCRPIHLLHYAVMASAYASDVLGIENPSVGLLNIGEETEKGTDLIKQCHELLSACKRINFKGNVEGSDFWSRKVNAVMMDGFVGNVVLKLMEGEAESLMHLFVSEATSAEEKKVAQTIVEKLAGRLHYAEYGAAPLLGLENVLLIGHGKSNARAFENGIKQAAEIHTSRLNEHISQAISQMVEVATE